MLKSINIPKSIGTPFGNIDTLGIPLVSNISNSASIAVNNITNIANNLEYYGGVDLSTVNSLIDRNNAKITKGLEKVQVYSNAVNVLTSAFSTKIPDFKALIGLADQLSSDPINRNVHIEGVKNKIADIQNTMESVFNFDKPKVTTPQVDVDGNTTSVPAKTFSTFKDKVDLQNVDFTKLDEALGCSKEKMATFKEVIDPKGGSSSAMSKARKKFERASNDLDDGYAFLQSAFPGLPGMNDLINPFKSTVNTAIGEYTSKLKGTANGVLGKANGVIGGTTSKINGFASQGTAKITGIVGGATSKINGLIGSVTSRLTGTSVEATTSLSGTINGITSKLTGASKEILGKVDDATIGRVEDQILNYSDYLANMSGANMEPLNGLLFKFIDKKKSPIFAKFNALENKLNSKVAGVNSKITGAQDKLNSKVNEATSKFNSKITDAQDKLNSKVNEATSKIDGYRDIFNSKISGITSKFTGNADSVENTIDGYKEIFNTGTENIAEEEDCLETKVEASKNTIEKHNPFERLLEKTPAVTKSTSITGVISKAKTISNPTSNLKDSLKLTIAKIPIVQDTLKMVDYKLKNNIISKALLLSTDISDEMTKLAVNNIQAATGVELDPTLVSEIQILADKNLNKVSEHINKNYSILRKIEKQQNILTSLII